MDVEEVRAKKRLVEQEIANLIMGFSKETGIGIAGVSIDVIPARRNGHEEGIAYTNVELDVWL